MLSATLQPEARFRATLGLPRLNPVNEQFCARLPQLLGVGHDDCSLIPGLHKVVQVAGRVIRIVSDQGVVHLMDDRHQRRQIRALWPRWWQLP